MSAKQMSSEKMQKLVNPVTGVGDTIALLVDDNSKGYGCGSVKILEVWRNHKIQ